MQFKKKQETTTTFVRKEDVKRQWLEIDATGKTLGRFASEIAKILRGKHKPNYTPNVDNGDGVIIVNASRIHLTGAKEAQKSVRYYTGHIGGMRELPYRHLLQSKPEVILMHAIKGMMPKTRLGKQQARKLRVFAGAEHPFQAQKPQKVDM